MEGIEYPSYDELDDAVRLPVACMCANVLGQHILCMRILVCALDWCM